jgi:hypothetical protein
MNIHEFRMAGQANAQIIIADETYSNFNNATTSKHNVTDESGILVLASDDDNGHVYGHASIGVDAPPPPTPPPTPTTVPPDGESALYLPLLNVP